MQIDCEALKQIDVWEQCPYCFDNLTYKDIIGEGEYPLRIGHNVGGKTLVYECSHCFEKSFCHYSAVLVEK